MTAEMRKEETAKKQNGINIVSYLREYKHTRLSKVLVSNGFSNIYNGLVQDRISYALHNPQEIMIVWMRYSSEYSQTR